MKKGSETGSPTENDKAISTTPATADASNSNQERPSIPAHMMRRRRKKRSKPATTKKRRRGVSESSDGLGCSITAEATKPADEETLTRELPEKTPVSGRPTPRQHPVTVVTHQTPVRLQ
ncbi:hypothetical protein MTO96_031661 [Rhipicephalus appendiculatus]